MRPRAIPTQLLSLPSTGITNACHHAKLLMWVLKIKATSLGMDSKHFVNRAICPVSGLGFWHRMLLCHTQLACNSLCRPCCPQTCGNPSAVTLWAKVPGEWQNLTAHSSAHMQALPSEAQAESNHESQCSLVSEILSPKTKTKTKHRGNSINMY